MNIALDHPLCSTNGTVLACRREHLFCLDFAYRYALLRHPSVLRNLAMAVFLAATMTPALDLITSQGVSRQVGERELTVANATPRVNSP